MSQQFKEAGIAIDRWKLPIFKRILVEHGYNFTVQHAEQFTWIKIAVQASKVGDLTQVVQKCNDEALNSKQ